MNEVENLNNVIDAMKTNNQFYNSKNSNSKAFILKDDAVNNNFLPK